MKRTLHGSLFPCILFILFGGILHGLGLKDKTIYSEPGKSLASELMVHKEKGVLTKKLDLFSLDHSKSIIPNLESTLHEATILQLDYRELMRFITDADNKDLLEISLPYAKGGSIELELFEVKIHTDEFTVTLSQGTYNGANARTSKFYRGVCKNKPGSIAAFSFFEGQVLGMFSDETGNYVIAPVPNSDQYILYNSEDLKVKQEYNCETDDLMRQYPIRKTHGDSVNLRNEGTYVDKCIGIFMECDHALFLDKGGVQQTLEYIYAVFNAVSTLYQNESITLVLSEVFVWNTKDNYSTASSTMALNQFRATRSNFNGDLAHLVSLSGNNIGGVAWLDVLCFRSFGYGYSNIRSTFNDVPLYSWTVEVIAHEIGHNLGSRHTQWCGWEGGPLDDCASPEGACNRGPTPMNGGTVMSYCHLTSQGVNFANGFGFQPGNRIRDRVNASDCLSSCYLLDTPYCMRPTGIKADNITTSSAQFSWSNMNLADSFEVVYHLNLEDSPIYATKLDTNTISINGLDENTEYVLKIRAICNDSLTGDFSSPFIFKTPIDSEYCQSKGNSANLQWISMIELGEIKRLSGNDGGYYDASYLSTEVEAGKSYILKFKADMPTGPVSIFWRMWIDLDGDGSLSEEGDLIFSRISNTSNPLARVIHIPAHAKPGSAKMRISMKYGSYAGPCEIFGEGEVEDFTIVIQPKQGNLFAGSEAESLMDSELSVYPNPVSDQMIVQFDSNENIVGKARVVNMLGQLVKEVDIHAINGQNRQPFDLPEIVSGPYVLHLQFGNRVMQHNFIVR